LVTTARDGRRDWRVTVGIGGSGQMLRLIQMRQV
jgi:hypothetical protein